MGRAKSGQSLPDCSGTAGGGRWTARAHAGPTTRLRPAEISTGQWLGKQLGLELKESAHVGADYIAAGTTTTFDAIGTPDAYKNWSRDNGAGFLKQLVRHVTENTGVNYTAIDLQGA